MLIIKKLNLFSKFVLSYICIIIVLLLVVIPIATTAINAAKESALSAHKNYFNSGVALLSEELSNMTQTALLCDESLNFHRMQYLSPTSGSENILLSQELFKNLLMFKSSVIHDVYILFEENDIVFTNFSIYHSKKFYYDNFLSYENITFEAWQELVKSDTKIWASSNISASNTNNLNVITQVFPLNALNGALYTLIDTNKLSQMLADEDVLINGFIYMVDINNNVIYNSNTPEEIAINLTYNTNTANTNDFNILDSGTSLLDCKIYLGIYENQITTGLQMNTILIVVSIVVATIISIALSLGFALLSYNPIKKITREINKKTQNSNEYLLIHEAILEANVMTQKTQKEMMEALKKIKEVTFHKLLLGYVVKEQDIAQAMEHFGDIPKPFILVLIDIPAANNAIIDLNQALILLQKIMYKLYPDSSYVNFSINYIGAVIPIMSKESLLVLQQTLEDELGTYVHFAVSAQKQNILDLYKAREEALSCFNLSEISAFSKENSRVHFYNSEIYEDFNISFQNFQRLQELILSGERNRMLQVFQGISESIIGNKIVDATVREQIFYTVRLCVANAAYQIKNMRAEDYNIPVYEKGKPFSHQYNMLIEVAIEICETVEKHKKSHNTRLYMQIVGYIKENFANPNLSAVMIADEFKVSEKYVSHFIKEQTGKSYMSYVEDLRLSTAQRLLLDTNISVTDISTNVGFSNRNSFYKAFRRVYGVSPSEYRDNYNKRNTT